MTPIYNRAELEGRVVSLGALSRSPWGAPILPFVLEVARPGRGSDRIPCCAMDEYAEELAGRLTVGVLLHVEGALRWNAKRRTLGVCLRSTSGVWWMPEDEGVPGDSVHIQQPEHSAQGGHSAAPMSVSEVPPEHESMRETTQRVRQELEDIGKRRPWALFADDWYGEDETVSISEGTPRAAKSRDKPEDESEDEAVKRIAQEIEDFIRMKEAHGNDKS